MTFKWGMLFMVCAVDWFLMRHVVYCTCRLLLFKWGILFIVCAVDWFFKWGLLHTVCAGYWLLHEVHVCCLLYVQVTDFYMRYMYVVYCMRRLLTFTWGTCCLLHVQIIDYIMRHVVFACAGCWLLNEVCCLL